VSKRRDGMWQWCIGNAVEAAACGELPWSWSRMAAGPNLGVCGSMRAMALGHDGGAWSSDSGLIFTTAMVVGRYGWPPLPEPMLTDVEAGGDQCPTSSMVTDSSPLCGGSSC
jgi:hypothetical protein